MNSDDFKEIKDILNIYLVSHTANFQSRFDIIEIKLDNLTSGLNNQNIEINKLKEQKIDIEKHILTCPMAKVVSDQKIDIEKHILTCPLSPRVQKLENEQFTKKEIKKFLLVSIGTMSIILGIVVSILKIIQ